MYGLKCSPLKILKSLSTEIRTLALMSYDRDEKREWFFSGNRVELKERCNRLILNENVTNMNEIFRFIGIMNVQVIKVEAWKKYGRRIIWCIWLIGTSGLKHVLSDSS